MAFGKTEKIRAIPHVVAGVMMLVLAAPYAAADIVLQVDLSDMYDPGGNWAVIGNDDRNSTVNNLKDFNTGNATTVAYTGTGFGGGIGATWYWSAGSKDWVVDNAGDDLFWTTDTASITFSGLGTNAWKVELVCARNINNLGDYQVGGSFADGNYNNTPGVTGDDFNVNLDGTQPGNWLIWSSVTPSGGAITITATSAEAAYANAVRLEELTATIPEPTTCALFALGLGAVLTRRRRR